MTSPPPRSPAQRFTLSNGLTFLRLLAAPIAYCSIVGEAWGVACGLFWLAVVSDLIDGRLARARGESSAFGGLLDHASDATFVTLGLIALALDGRVPALLPGLVVAAFVQYMLDSRALAGRALRTSALGRWNGILYFVPVGTIVTREALGLPGPSDGLVLASGWALSVSTIVSMGDRAWTLLAASRSGEAGR